MVGRIGTVSGDESLSLSSSTIPTVISKEEFILGSEVLISISFFVLQKSDHVSRAERKDSGV